ncbi:MAG: creatininase family protein [Thermoproteota archaeon]|nr:creatininase family protein [Candidatus Brockarchaeota archaeon]
MKVKYEEMTPKEFLEAVEKMPVFIVPTGLLEWHGDHLPLGQDALKAYGICLRVAEKLGGGIVLPPNYWGRPGFSTYVGTLTFSDGLIRTLFWELFEQLRKVGAKLVLVVTGHYGPCQVDCLKGVAEDFNRCHPDVYVIVQPEYEGIEIDGEVPADHAGKWETSMFWHMYPQLTVLEEFKPGRIKVHTYPDAPYNYYRESPVWEWREDIRIVSSPELGRKAVDIIVDNLVKLVKQKLEELKRL